MALCFDGGMSNADLVRHFLRGQNLEQVGRVDDAVELYEQAVSAGFDSSGPYDRLIQIYANRALHREVIRVATAAIGSVHTYDDKQAWYERMRAEAQRALARVPAAAPKEAGEAGTSRSP